MLQTAHWPFVLLRQSRISQGHRGFGHWPLWSFGIVWGFGFGIWDLPGLFSFESSGFAGACLSAAIGAASSAPGRATLATAPAAGISMGRASPAGMSTAT
jgi:hypothetical protein